VVIAADTVGWINGHVVGKPEDEADARRILTELSGTTHELWSGVCVWATRNHQQICWQELSQVRMKALSQVEITAYLQTRKWVGCSGAYAIQMPTDPYLEVVSGTVSNVIGLPMETLAQVLKLVDPLSAI
jgi:septum formation protein